MDSSTLTLFSGNAHPALARDIAKHLGLSLGRINVGRFSDGEVSVEIMENVRGNEVVLVQPTCPPTNDNLMELLVMADACKRASAESARACFPRWPKSPAFTSQPILQSPVSNPSNANGSVTSMRTRPLLSS